MLGSHFSNDLRNLLRELNGKLLRLGLFRSGILNAVQFAVLELYANVCLSY